MQLSPIIQSCAMWQYVIIKQFLPIIVCPVALVPLFIVTYSLIIVLSPIITFVFSLLYFKSWGSDEIIDPGYILQFLPILAPGNIVTFDPIHEFFPISTSS